MEIRTDMIREALALVDGHGLQHLLGGMTWHPPGGYRVSVMLSPHTEADVRYLIGCFGEPHHYWLSGQHIGAQWDIGSLRYAAVAGERSEAGTALRAMREASPAA